MVPGRDKYKQNILNSGFVAELTARRVDFQHTPTSETKGE